MDSTLILKDLQATYGPRKVLYSDDVAAILGKSVGAVYSMKSKDGFPLPIIEVGGRPGVSIYAMADWLADGAHTKPKASTSKAPPLAPPKRKRESLGKFLRGLRTQRNFLAELDAEVERLVIAEEARPAARKRATPP